MVVVRDVLMSQDQVVLVDEIEMLGVHMAVVNNQDRVMEIVDLLDEIDNDLDHLTEVLVGHLVDEIDLVQVEIVSVVLVVVEIVVIDLALLADNDDRGDDPDDEIVDIVTMIARRLVLVMEYMKQNVTIKCLSQEINTIKIKIPQLI